MIIRLIAVFVASMLVLGTIFCKIDDWVKYELPSDFQTITALLMKSLIITLGYVPDML